MPSWKRLIVSGSDASLNSLTVTNGITGSLFGTASWARNATSASYALTASYAENITISGSITDVDYINFDVSASYTLTTGRLGWDNGEGTLQLGLVGGNVQYSLGEQLWQYCFNAEGTTLTKGQVVYVSGSQGNKIAITLADNSGDPRSAGTLGFVGETILAGESGWVITEGTLRKVNTLGLPAGALLFLGATPGTYTTTVPTAPSHSVRLGYVERVDATVGSIYVKIDNGYELGELHDVVDTTTTSSYGDLLIKSGSVWINSKQLTGSYGLTGSLTAINGGFTGSLQGTASWANNAISASYAVTASSAISSSRATSAVSSSYPLAVISDSLITPLQTSNYGTTRNVFIGFFVGSNTTGVSDAVFIGSSAGAEATNSAGSVFIGGGAGYAITKPQTVAIGGSAGFNSTNAQSSVLIGTNAGNSSTNASQSVFIGIESGIQSTNAYNSTFIGYQSGYQASNANSSVLIGFKSGYNASGVGISSNNIIIGTNITLADGRQDSINLGGLIFGTGSYSTTTGAAFSGSTNGRIGINQPTPTFSLDVSGSGRYTSDVQVSGSLTVSSSLYSAGGNTAAAATTTTILTIATGSYRAGFFDYTVSSGSNARAGTVMSVWNGSSVEFTDTSTLSIGSTSDLVMSVTLSGANALLRATTTTSAWTVKTAYRLI